MKYYSEFEWIALHSQMIYCPQLQVSIMWEFDETTKDDTFKIFHGGSYENHETISKKGATKSYLEMFEFMKTKLMGLESIDFKEN